MMISGNLEALSKKENAGTAAESPVGGAIKCLSPNSLLQSRHCEL
jgi:hypothetical protein